MSSNLKKLIKIVYRLYIMKYVLRVMMEYQVVLKGAENKQVRVSRIRVSKQLTF